MGVVSRWFTRAISDIRCLPLFGTQVLAGLRTRHLDTFACSLMVARSQSSSAGVLALLSEPEAIFKQHALKALNPLVPQFWAEISEHIALMFVIKLVHSCLSI